MAKRPLFAPGTQALVQGLVKKAKTALELRRILCVLLGCSGIPAKDIAPLVGYHESFIWHFWAKFRIQGETIFWTNNHSGHRNRAHLSVEEEKALLKSFLATAEKGGMLIIKEVHEAFEKKLGHSVFLSVIYDLLHRHGWRKIAPRPTHPKSDMIAQNLFKVSFPPQGLGSRYGSKREETLAPYHVSG